jgi:hypothetical protein
LKWWETGHYENILRMKLFNGVMNSW